MNLDFGVLWIEDSFDDEEKSSLERRIANAGFIPRIVNIENGVRLDELAREHKLFHKYDIILLDFKLLNENGDEIAPLVRQKFPSTTILFYSGTVEESELRQKMAAKQVEGVYCSARSRFIERTGTLIDETARSLDRLSGMRGLAMKVVADCDEIMKDAVRSMCARDPSCLELIGKLDRLVFDHLDDQRRKYQEAVEHGLEARLATFAIDSSKLFSHFRTLTQRVAANPAQLGLDANKVERLKELRERHKHYGVSVLRKRNVLGHAVEVEGADGWTLRSTSPDSTPISLADFAEIRRTFASYVAAFREMRDLVASNDG